MYKSAILRDVIQLIIGLYTVIYGFRYFRNMNKPVDEPKKINEGSWFYSKTIIGRLFLERRKARNDKANIYALDQKIGMIFIILVSLFILLSLVLKWLGYVTPDGYFKLR